MLEQLKRLFGKPSPPTVECSEMATQPPMYSGLPERGSSQFPEDLRAEEGSDAFDVRWKQLQREIADGAAAPADDTPAFVVLLISGRPVTISAPSAEQCLLVFTTPSHAVDYARVRLRGAQALTLDRNTASSLFGLIRTGDRVGIRGFTVDDCPRCGELTIMIASRGVQAAERLVWIWCHRRAFELALVELSFARALESARAGSLDVARDIALETAAHVILEDSKRSGSAHFDDPSPSMRERI